MRTIKEIREGDTTMRAGIVVVDGEKVLGCLPTPTIKYLNIERKLDLPKGHMQEGESPIEAAIRECWEETNIKFESWKLKFVNSFTVWDSPLFLFVAKITAFPELSELSCPSTFKKGVVRSPENCAYELVPYEKVKERFFPELVVPVQESIKLSYLL